MILFNFIRASILPFIVAIVLLLPSGVQFIHSVQGHQHPVCTDFDTHLHKKELDCSLCDFQISVFHFTPQKFDEPVLTLVNFRSEFDLVENYHTSQINLNSLRGPPSLV